MCFEITLHIAENASRPYEPHQSITHMSAMAQHLTMYDAEGDVQTSYAD